MRHATLTFAAAKEVRNQHYYSFWRSVSNVLGSRHEKFPLSLFYAALDISGGGDMFPMKNYQDNEGQGNAYYPSSRITRNRRIDRNILSLVLITYLGSFLCLLCGVSILISSTILSNKTPHNRFPVETNHSMYDSFSTNNTHIFMQIDHHNQKMSIDTKMTNVTVAAEDSNVLSKIAAPNEQNKGKRKNNHDIARSRNFGDFSHPVSKGAYIPEVVSVGLDMRKINGSTT